MTYREAYQYGVKQLESAGIEEAKLDAELLLEAVCGTSRQDLLAHGERAVSENDSMSYAGLIKRRKEHVPLQYLTGEQEFMGLSFQVNEHVLIPRQDTEILVEEVMRYLHDGMRMLDLCTGSGCILLSLLHYSNGCSGVGVDISAEALETARENARRLGIRTGTEGVEFVEADILLSQGLKSLRRGECAILKEQDALFDIIVSNPPYIASGVIPQLMEEVRGHEPLVALDGGEDGLVFYRRIVGEAGGFLHREGRLFLEIGNGQEEAVSGLLREHGYADIQIVKDYAGIYRVVQGIWPG